jgi:hypothetical protein
MPAEAARLIKATDVMPWTAFISDKNRDRCNPEGLDLLSKMLVYDKNKRPNFILGTFVPDKLETIRGNEVDCDTIFVQREIGPVLDVISIRYSQYARNSSLNMFGD